jgi:hypothetical protein
MSRHFTVAATPRICLSMEARKSLGSRSACSRPFHAAAARSVVSTAIFHSGLAKRRRSINHAWRRRRELSQFRAFRFGLLQDGDVRIRRFSRGEGGQRHWLVIARPPFHYRWTEGCQPNLVGVVPFAPLFLSSVERIRAPVVEGNLRNSPAASGSWY